MTHKVSVICLHLLMLKLKGMPLFLLRYQAVKRLIYHLVVKCRRKAIKLFFFLF